MTSENYYELEGKYVPKRFDWSVFASKVFSFVIGCLTVSFVYFIGFRSAQNISGWINAPVVRMISPLPVAGQSAQLK